MQLLILNPNTSVVVTERLREHVASIAAPEVALHAATAAFGARYIADEISFAVAGHAALDAYASHCQRHGKPDAVLVGCFGDPGVWALRELSGLPVVGLAEAAMREAAGFGRFAIVTGGVAWDPMLRRLARAFGFTGALADVHVVAPTGAQLAADPAMALSVLGKACQQAAEGADAVILGGAGLAGMAALLAPHLTVPLIDSVTAGARALCGDCSDFVATSLAMTQPVRLEGVSAALQGKLR